METTTGIDYSMYEGLTPPEPCYRNEENTFGAYLSILYYFVFFVSVFGNVLVLVIIYRFEKLTTVTNILLLNLVFSSLIFVSSLPFLAIYQQLTNWVFGNPMCKIVSSVYYLGFYSSVLFLTLLTFDRHIAVVYSLGASSVRNRRYALISCAVVWLVSSLMCVKEMLLFSAFFHHIDKRTYCLDTGRNLISINVQKLKESGFYIQLFLFLIFPFLIITYCYIRIAITVLSSKLVTRFKTVRLIFFTVLLFFLCWTPYNIALLLQYKAPAEGQDCDDLTRMAYALHVTRNLTYVYFCISPFFYTFVGKKFQNYFRQMLVKQFPSLKRRVSVTEPSGTDMSTRSTANEH